MAKWVKWNIRVEQEIVFLRFSFLWWFSEDVLYLDNYTMLFCFFEYGYICVLHSIFLEIFVSKIICFIHRIVVIVQSVWHSLSLRNYPFVLARQTADSEIFNSLVHVSDISDRGDVLSPDLLSHGSRCSTSRSDLLKVAQNSFQHFPRRSVWWVIITTLYQLMLQSWYQKAAQSLVNTLVLFSWHNRFP